MRELLTYSVEERAYPRPALVSSKGSASVRYDTRGGIADRYQQYKARLKGAAEAHLPAGWEPIEGPIELRVVIERESLKSAPGRVFKLTPPDVHDNIVKPIADALSGVVYVDDRQIVGMHIAECYGPIDLITIQVNELDTEAVDWVWSQAGPRS